MLISTSFIILNFILSVLFIIFYLFIIIIIKKTIHTFFLFKIEILFLLHRISNENKKKYKYKNKIR